MTRARRWFRRRKRREFYVYVLANRSKMLYIGVTGDLERRISEHKQKLLPGYAARYNLNQLVYYEVFPYVVDAIAREKQLKHWLRARKVALVEQENPTWADLAADWYD